MNLEPIPIGTPAPTQPVEPTPNERILGRMTKTWGRSFGLGVGVGILIAFAVGLLFVLARENEWQDRLRRQNGGTPETPISTGR